MTVGKHEIWLANLDPQFGTEAGKTRPVLIVQTDKLNLHHPSTIVLPITTNVQPQAQLLRVHIPQGTAGVKQDCDVMIDQIRTIDNRRFIRKIGTLPANISALVSRNLSIVLDIGTP